MNRAVIVGFFLLCACTQQGVAVNSSVELVQQDNAEKQRTESALRLQAFALDPFEEPIEDGDSQGLVGARDRLVERFGKPIAQESSRFSDRTSDLMLTYAVLQYEGVAFHLIENEDGGRSWIEKIDVTGNTHTLKYGLHIGSTRGDVISLFQPGEHLLDRNPMRLSTNGVQNPPNMAVWEGPVIDVAIDFDSADRVTRILVEKIEL